MLKMYKWSKIQGYSFKTCESADKCSKSSKIKVEIWMKKIFDKIANCMAVTSKKATRSVGQNKQGQGSRLHAKLVHI